MQSGISIEEANKILVLKFGANHPYGVFALFIEILFTFTERLAYDYDQSF